MRHTDKLRNGFLLIQDDRFFKLGQDSDMLSHFVSLKENMKICDLGCGNGALSILLYTLKTNINVDAVEIQKEVYDLAMENKELNKLDKLNIINADLRDNIFQNEYYDLVVSNPPYFKDNSGLKSQKINKQLARSEDNCTLADVCKKAASLLKFGGKFAIVHKPDRLCEIICEMKNAGIEAKRIQFVLKNPYAQASTVLIEGKKGAKSGTIIEKNIILG